MFSIYIYIFTTHAHSIEKCTSGQSVLKIKELDISKHSTTSLFNHIKNRRQIQEVIIVGSSQAIFGKYVI